MKKLTQRPPESFLGPEAIRSTDGQKWAASENVEQRAWRLASLAAMVLPKTTLTIQEGGKRSLDAVNREISLEWALDEAEYLLMSAERRCGVVHAYQLFRKEDFIGLTGIQRIFKEHNWSDLTSWAACENLLGEILKELREFQNACQTQDGAQEWPALDVPRLTTTSHPFWVDPELLVQRHGKRKQYWADRIFLMAHLFCHDKFKHRIQRNIPDSTITHRSR